MSAIASLCEEVTVLGVAEQGFLSLSTTDTAILNASLLPVRGTGTYFLAKSDTSLLRRTFLCTFPLIVVSTAGALSAGAIATKGNETPVGRFDRTGGLTSTDFHAIIAPGISAICART